MIEDQLHAAISFASGIRSLRFEQFREQQEIYLR
jgi:hypothetical protein